MYVLLRNITMQSMPAYDDTISSTNYHFYAGKQLYVIRSAHLKFTRKLKEI